MVENFIMLTAHASDRMLERFGFEEIDIQQNIAERAWRNGKTYRDYSGKASKFLYRVQTRHSKNEYIVKTYANKLFVFSDSGIFVLLLMSPRAFKG